MDSKSLFVLFNLGLGDAILCNGLIRWYSKLYENIKVPSYEHNFRSVSYMFEDLTNVEVISIRDEADMILRSHGKNCLKLGWYSTSSFDPKIFDQEFYKHANVPFEERWRGFKLPEMQIGEGSEEDFALAHHDPRRGFLFRSTSSLETIFVEPTKPFFDWRQEIHYAREIHCINSSFMILVDSLPEIEGQNLYFHHYARPTDFPTLKKKWKILSTTREKRSNDIPETSQVNVQ